MASTLRVICEPHAARADPTNTPAFAVTLGREDITRHLTGEPQYSSVDPGGFETATVTLPRDATVRRGDRLRITSGLDVAWEGRVSEPERDLSDTGVQTMIACEGYGAALSDGVMAAIYVDRDLTRWGEPSDAFVQSDSNTPRAHQAAIIYPDSGGHPILSTETPGSSDLSGGLPESSAMYDAGDASVAYLYAYILLSGINPVYSDWTWELYGSGADNVDPYGTTGPYWQYPYDYQSEPTGLRYYTMPAISGDPLAQWRYAFLRLYNGTLDTKSTQTYRVLWRDLTAYGLTGVPLRGPDPQGVYGSDVARHVIAQLAGLDPGIIPDADHLIIPHLAYPQQVAHEQILSDTAALCGWHYGTWESLSLLSDRPRVDFRPRPAAPTCWAPRHALSDLKLSEPLSELYDQCVVTYTDPAGKPATATWTLPVPELADLGLTRTLQAQLGTMTQTAALTVAYLLLAGHAQDSTAAGTATLRGTIDTATGRRPTHMLRPGLDRLRITDLPGGGAFDASGGFHLRRTTTTIGKDGTRTEAELDAGGGLLDLITARLSETATVTGRS